MLSDKLTHWHQQMITWCLCAKPTLPFWTGKRPARLVPLMAGQSTVSSLATRHGIRPSSSWGQLGGTCGRTFVSGSKIIQRRATLLSSCIPQISQLSSICSTIKREWRPCRRGSHGRILSGSRHHNLKELYVLHANLNAHSPSDIDIFVF
jgi:hypothetical protein